MNRPAALEESRLRPFLRRRRRQRGALVAPELGDLLAETLALAGRLVPSRASALLLDRPGGPRRRAAAALTQVAAFGPAAESRVGLVVALPPGILATVYREGQCLAVQGELAAAAAQLLDPRAERPPKSMVAAPIRLERAVCGILVLVGRRGRAGFDARDRDLTELLAQYVSRAILNAVDLLKQNELALLDGLTGVLGVRGLEPHLAEEVARAGRRKRGDLAVLFCDVDRLKRINDRHGHRAGSEVLCNVAHALDAEIGEAGRVFRFGGDEFVCVCPGVPAAEAETLARRVVERVGRLARRRGGPETSVSVGVATLAASLDRERRRGGEAERLLVAADRALYRAKRSGRGRHAVAAPADDR